MLYTRAHVTALEANVGRGDQSNKGASLNLAVVLSWKLAVGCSHMAPDHPCLVAYSVGIQRLAGFGVLNGCLFGRNENIQSLCGLTAGVI